MASSSERDVEKGIPRSATITSSDDEKGSVLQDSQEPYPTDASECVTAEEIESEHDTMPIEPVRSRASRVSRVSVKSRLSRVASLASTVLRRKKERLARAPLPVSDLDNGIVGWEGQDDPKMPLNFPKFRKWLIVSFLSLITFVTPFASSILAPGITTMSKEFGTSNLTYASMPVSIFLLGYAVGPLFLAPLSELYGRHPVLSLSNAFFAVWQIGCALSPSLDSLIVFRFLSGIGGSACMTLGGGVVADLFPVDERGLALSVWTIGPLVGPCIGPLVGAWIAYTIGWRWVFWVSLIPAVIVTVVIGVFSTETYHQVIISKKVRRLRKELGREDLRSCYADPSKPPPPMKEVILQGLCRPLKMLILNPLILLLSTYIAFAYAVLYLLFNTIPMVFEGQYGWSVGLTGLVYLPLGLGFCAGLAVFASLSDKTVVKMTRANDGVYEPEMRLPACIFFACFLPITFFVYGWSTYNKVHVAVPLIGLIPYGFGLVGIWQPIQAYIIDSYPVYAASGMAAFTVLRSLVAAFLPLAGPKMYDTMGLGWGNSLLGFICIAMIPVPAFIYKFGGKLRKKWALNL
ncbi:major facilitator superfamily transporter multidrug resistance [Zalerion maritima]|uniref:Major facilitator superfamily transporter multidrug resistance n=1 Tax=Zalerion maritima TaxID=339359 RepID=A0AAD5WQE9_9PEZI|nr:major facilitator superfamily transporter multidrug resistance [Zalerion maritima]